MMVDRITPRRALPRGALLGIRKWLPALKLDEGANPFSRWPGQQKHIYDSSAAFSVIFVLKSLETGQPALALPVAVSKAAWLAPGTLAFNSRWLSVMAKPLSVFSSEIVAVTSMRSAVRPAAPSCPDNAMAKQPAW